MKIDGPIEAFSTPSNGVFEIISPSMKIDGPIEAAWRPSTSSAAPRLSVDEDRRPH